MCKRIRQSASYSHSANDEIIQKPNKYDVLCGRGGGTNNQYGNLLFRQLVRKNKALYNAVPRSKKTLLAESIVLAMQRMEPPGRFLVRHKMSNAFCEIDRKRAVEKTCQALREKTSNVNTTSINQKNQELELISNTDSGDSGDISDITSTDVSSGDDESLYSPMALNNQNVSLDFEDLDDILLDTIINEPVGGINETLTTESSDYGDSDTSGINSVGEGFTEAQDIHVPNKNNELRLEELVSADYDENHSTFSEPCFPPRILPSDPLNENEMNLGCIT